jgi:galactokinase
MRDVQADAPGRVNLIGEHTDYHDGFVLPSAVPQRTNVTLRVRGDRHVRARSADVPGEITFEIGAETKGRGWGDYVQGLTWVLTQQGHRLHGFDLAVRSDVPLGSGLSSSAALEVATLRAMRAAFDLDLDDVALARAAQRAEVEFVGAPVGIMDQMASSLAGEHDALFLDTMTLAFERIPLPSSLDLVVIDSGVAHRHAGGDYVTRRRESEEAARRLGVERLRHAPPDALTRLAALPPVLARRARHVITENSRVIEARAALRHADLAALGRLFRASHASMRDDYEITIPEIDLLVRLADAHPRAFGARMTGGGFGGAIVIAAAEGSGREVAAHVSCAYDQQSGRRAVVLLPAAT